MENSVKELTIIDFLGMIVPGSLLVLLFHKDYEVQSIWNDYFGNDTVANTIILLVAGYLIGMLIHEWGDILEKAVWKLNLLNPRYCAAKRVFSNVNSTYRTLNSASWEDFHKACVEENPSVNKEEGHSTQECQSATETPGGEKNCQNRTSGSCMDWNKFPFALWPAIALGSFCNAIFVFPISAIWGTRQGKTISTCVVVMVTLVVFVIALGVAVCSSFWEKGNGNEAIYVSHNASIQTEVFGKGTAAKRQLFDGFYCVMRNLLMVIGITNVYALFMLVSGDPSPLTEAAAQFYQDGTQTILYGIVVMGMLYRCWHYAYLKYKYSYEDYLCLLQQKGEKSSSSTKRIILSIQSSHQSEQN